MEMAATDLARKYVGGHDEKPQWMEFVVQALPQCALLDDPIEVAMVFNGVFLVSMAEATKDGLIQIYIRQHTARGLADCTRGHGRRE